MNSAASAFLAGTQAVMSWLCLPLGLSPSAFASQGNDDFANRLPLQGFSFQITSDNLGATKELGEPYHAQSVGGASVWWQWTAPATAVYELSTAGSAIDTLLAVYTGDSLTNLVLVAANDDEPSDRQILTSLVRFTGHAGVVYSIAVDGFNAAQGTIRLRLDSFEPPANDAFASPAVLAGTTWAASGETFFATKELGEPDHAAKPGGASVWWTWTAPSTGAFELSTEGSDFDTLLAVYTGDALAGLTQVSANDDVSGSLTTSLLLFSATSNTRYRIVVDGFDGAQGQIALVLRPIPPPVNDHFANATPLQGTVVFASGINYAATKELGEPDHAGQPGGASVWWRWTAPTNGLVDLRTTGSAFNTLLAVYTGATVATLSLVAANNDEPGPLATSSRLQFQASQGTLYRFAVDGFNGQQGTIQLELRIIDPPVHDDFANALALMGTDAVDTGSNIDATKEPGEPNHVGNRGGASVWWFWIAPTNGPTTVTTAGSTFDTLLAVYTGNAVSSLQLVAANDDSPAGGTSASQVQFAARANQGYAIAVDGFLGAQGLIELSLRQESVVPADPVLFSIPRLQADGRVLCQLDVPLGTALRLETSTNLVIWELLWTTTSVVTPFEIHLDPRQHFLQFLRAHVQESAQP